MNGIGQNCVHCEMKLLATIRIMSTVCAVDSLDDCVYMAEGCIRQYFTQFYVGIMEKYGGQFYNRIPTNNEMENIKKVIPKMVFLVVLELFIALNTHGRTVPVQ